MTNREAVFISSTSIDLPEYRAAVRDAVLSLGLFPSGMETWPVDGDSTIELCKNKLAEAEIFLGIYAHRYGWCPPGYNDKSITELEYDWATERGIRRFCFVVDAAYPWPAESIGEAADDRLMQFKLRVQEELAIGFFTTPDDLKAKVLAALAPYAQQETLYGVLPYLRWLNRLAKQSALLQVLEGQHSNLVGDDVQITMDMIYTPLNTSRIIARDTAGNAVGEPEPRETSLAIASSSDILQDRTPLTLMEAANQNSRLVLLGDPGSGKSTFLAYLALCLTGEYLMPDTGWLRQMEDQGWVRGQFLPILVTLRDFAQDIPVDDSHEAGHLLWKHVVQQLNRRNCSSAVPVLEAALASGTALVLLDGLDEVPLERVDWVRDILSNFVATQHPANRYLVTCRILSYAHEGRRLSGFSEETIAPLSRSQIGKFIATWYSSLANIGNLDADLASQLATSMIQHLQGDLEDVASNPMLLTVMALVHDHLGKLPRERARLYALFVELLMLRWKSHDADTITSRLGIREDDLYRILWEIAYDAHSKQEIREGAADISEADVVAIMRKRLGDLAKAQELCNYIERRAGLLIGRGQDAGGWRVFAFPHRTFQEYLAGCHIANNRFTRQAFRLSRTGSNWREPLMFAVGHLIFNQADIATPIDVANTVCPPETPKGEGDWRAIWLAGDILLLVGLENVEYDEIGREVLPRVHDRLVDLLHEGHLSPIERASAGRSLSRLGDRRRGVGVDPYGDPDLLFCEIPAGPFTMGSDRREEPHAAPRELPKHLDKSIQQTFLISRYPITNAQFQMFVQTKDGYWDDSNWTPEGLKWRGSLSPTVVPAGSVGLANHPVTAVTWYECWAFCKWATSRLSMGAKIYAWQNGMVQPLTGAGLQIRLASEVEWEKAARGSLGSRYTWGDSWHTDGCNSKEALISSTTAVGIFPQGRSIYGVMDMCGNTWEWCQNTWGWTYERAFTQDLNDPSGTTQRAVRGGGFDNNRMLVRAACRFGNRPEFKSDDLGFRVVAVRSST